MARFKLGIQLYSLRDEMADDFKGTLRKVKEMGYDGVEFAGLFDNTADDVKNMCDEIGLVPISAHVPFGEIMDNGKDTFKTYSKIGCKFIVIPSMPAEYRPESGNFYEFIENVKKIGAAANEFGMKLCYHNHDFEFEKINGEYVIDVLYKEVPSELLETQLDTCWINVGGENPSDYIIKYGHRTNIIHLKDFVGSKTDNMYELIGVKSNEGKAESQEFDFRPVGYGVQNFEDILNAAEKIGAQWLIVEQDKPSLDKSPSECAQMSIEYLKKIN